MSAPVRLSVVVPTTHTWPFLKPLLEILMPQCEALQAELLIADSTGDAVPSELRSKLRHIVVPVASVFALRAQATADASGEIVAWTEDHCLPASDWCAKICEAHAARPDADIIGGAVLNGSCEAPMDWANFLCTFGPFVPPLDRAPTKRAPAVANLSMKHRTVPRGALRAGWIESAYLPRLLASGRTQFDGIIQVTHVQSWGFWGTFAAHFHNGRSTTGLLADPLSPWKRARQAFVCLMMPFELTRTSIAPLIGKSQTPWLRHAPLVVALAVAFSLGELVGLVAKGAGRSPLRLE